MAALSCSARLNVHVVLAARLRTPRVCFSASSLQPCAFGTSKGVCGSRSLVLSHVDVVVVKALALAVDRPPLP